MMLPNKIHITSSFTISNSHITCRFYSSFFKIRLTL